MLTACLSCEYKFSILGVFLTVEEEKKKTGMTEQVCDVLQRKNRNRFFISCRWLTVIVELIIYFRCKGLYFVWIEFCARSWCIEMSKCSTKHVLNCCRIVVFCFKHSLCHNIENNTITFVLVRWQKSTSGEILNFAPLNLSTFQVNFHCFSLIGLSCYIMFIWDCQSQSAHI